MAERNRGFIHMLIIVAALAAQFTSGHANAQWKIKKAEVGYLYPDWSKVHQLEEDLAKSGAKNPGQYLGSEGLKAFYDSLNVPNNIPEGEAGFAFLTGVENAFSELAGIYSSLGLPEPDFLSKNGEGDTYVLYAYDFSLFNWDKHTPQSTVGDVAGYMSGPCTRDQQRKQSDHFGVIGLNIDALVDSLGGYSEQGIYMVVAHELFHAIQNRALMSQGLDACSAPDAWSEGTAQAVAVWLTEQKYPGYLKTYWASVSGKIAPYSAATVQGWFDYPLNWTALANEFELEDGKPVARRKNSEGGYGNAYALNPLFRYALERDELFPGRVGLEVAPLFLEGLSEIVTRAGKARPHMQANWWNNRLEQNGAWSKGKNAGPMSSLQLYFPEFLAHHADSWERYGVAENEWVDALFDGCRKLTLDKSGSWYTKTLVDIKQNSGQCFDVTVKDLGTQPAQVFQVFGRASIVGKDDDLSGLAGEEDDALDRLHLSVPELGGTLVSGQTYDCYGASRRGAIYTCNATPLTYTNKQNQQADVKSALGAGNKATWSRSWRVTGQMADTSTVENRYLLSLVTGDGLTISAKSFKVELEFGLRMNSDLRIDNGKPSNSSGGGTSETFGVVPPHPVKGDPANLLEPRQGPFFTAMAAMQPGVDGFPEQGIPFVSVTEFGEEAPDEPVEGQSLFQFFFEEPLLFGVKGNFPAGIGGSRMGPGDNVMFYGNVGDKPSGRVEVVRFDREVLHLKLSGRYCEITMHSPECTGNKSVSVEMVRPFGWAHDIAQRPTSVFTPITELYARQVDALISGYTGPPTAEDGPDLTNGPNGPSGPGNNGNSSGPFGSGGLGVSESCTCSCEEFEEISRAAEAMEELPDDEMPDLSSFDFGIVQCAMECMQAYMSCDMDMP